MLSRFFCIATLSLAACAFGCTADVTTTDDSHRVTVETPKIETSGEKPDLDPTTDSDVDIDTPAPGDQ
jgi:hypothetical protein